MADLVVVNRFRVAADGEDRFRADAETAHATLAARVGYVAGHLGRNVDDPELWVLTTSWDTIGSYRRALSSYDVKVSAVPLLSQALDEPSAYELLEPGESPNRPGARELD